MLLVFVAKCIRGLDEVQWDGSTLVLSLIFFSTKKSLLVV